VSVIPISVVFIALGGVILTALGILMLGLIIILVYPRYKYPIVKIQNNTIITQSIFGKPVLIDDLIKYKLIISNDFIAFRFENKNDIMIDQENICEY